MTDIIFNHVQKKYGTNVVIPDISFTVESGERLVLLGPSGCGKSTLLRMIAGFEEINEGELIMDGKCVNDIDPGNRDVSMVFQNYALYPHMTVEENITYGLKVNKIEKTEIERRLDYVLEMLDLLPYRDRKPSQLSGGQRQRVALARATVKRSKAFLLDEPLSNLDAQLRIAARKSMLDIHQKFGQTTVYVTHDQIEAMTFATKIILLNKGEIQMYDTPENVYHYPANIFTAKFIGAPSMNLVKNVKLVGEQVRCQEQMLCLNEKWMNYLTQNKEYILGIRPENISIHTKEPESTPFLVGKINYYENQGANYAVYIDIADETFVAAVPEINFSVHDKVYIALKQNHLHFFDAETEMNIGRPEGL